MRTLQLNDSINTFDLAEALKNEYGTFKVILPSGDEIYVGCEPGHSITHFVWGDAQNKRPFLVTKITEPVTMDNRLAGAGAPPGIRAA
jgi:hypothetical protein